jgi:hypothetical protein
MVFQLRQMLAIILMVVEVVVFVTMIITENRVEIYADKSRITLAMLSSSQIVEP